MVSTHLEPLVHDHKLSSVVPATPTGDNNNVHELTNIDLAMKLHYVKGLYFFDKDSVQGIDITHLKKPMFQWLDQYSAASGRVRRSDSGRPFIKCNDSGVRIVEANCTENTLEEWMQIMKDRYEINDQLFIRHALGPDLGFSPLIFVQFTWFKCGGLSVGISWAHVLGDAFTASAFINMWGHIMAGHVPRQSLNPPNTRDWQFPPPNSDAQKPLSLKRVDPVGDHWITSNSCKMGTLSFHLTGKKLDHIIKTVGLIQVPKHRYFHFLAALMWKSVAKIRKGESEPRIVTICGSDSRYEGNEILSIRQVIGNVEADFKIEKANLLDLAKLMEEKMVDERSVIDQWVEKADLSKAESSDFILYGANLTFVNLEGLEIYGFHIKGRKPVFANYSVDGIGDDGIVLVLPGPENGKEGGCGGGGGRVVTAILPEYEIVELKNELKKECGIF